ncbi:MAG: group 1 glycosyl transferase, partial [Pseudomonadota bacterium]
MSHLENRRTILVYRDKLFLGSESFIPRAYRHFQALSPIYVGNGDGAGPDGATVIRLDGADG